MKKNKLDIEASIIDSYYNELSEKDTNLDTNNDSINISDKLNAVSEKLDSINDIDFDLDVNILSIIQNAEDIKVKKKNKYETLTFLLTSFVILSSLSLFVIASGFKSLIYFQVLITTLMPFIIIFMSILSKGEEEVQWMFPLMF